MNRFIQFHETQNQKLQQYIAKHIPNILIEKREKLLDLSFYFMLLFYTVWANFYNFSFGLRLLVCGAVFLFDLILFCDSHPVPMLHNDFWTIAFYLMGIGSLATAIVVRGKAYFLLSLVWLLLYPFARGILKHDVFHLWLKRYCITLCHFFVAVVFISLLLSPLTESQYGGIYTDPNDLAMICVMAIVSNFYLYRIEDVKKKGRHLLFSIVATTLIFFSRSRTGMVMMFWVYALLLAYLSVHKEVVSGKISKFVAGNVLCYLALYLVLSYGTPLAAHTIYPLINPAYKEQLERQEGKEITFEESLALLLQKSMKGAGDNQDVSSGRMRIWQAGMKKMSVFGHLDERVFVREYGYRKMLLHNAPLQIWYSTGVLGMAGYVLLMVDAAKKSLRSMKRFSRLTMESVTVLSFLGCYALYLFFFSSYHPFASPLTWIAFFASMAPPIARDDVIGRKKENA